MQKNGYDVDTHGLDPSAFVEARDPKNKVVRATGADVAVYLRNPKFAHNLGQAVRACSCFNVTQLWWHGARVAKELEGLSRIPREERMRGYEDVAILQSDRALDAFPKGVVPVAVELRPNSEDLRDFIHPEKAVYVFGPEDGSIDQGTLSQCHRFVKIPTKHCANLSAAVYMMLYDRLLKARR